MHGKNTGMGKIKLEGIVEVRILATGSPTNYQNHVLNLPKIVHGGNHRIFAGVSYHGNDLNMEKWLHTLTKGKVRPWRKGNCNSSTVGIFDSALAQQWSFSQPKQQKRSFSPAVQVRAWFWSAPKTWKQDVKSCSWLLNGRLEFTCKSAAAPGPLSDDGNSGKMSTRRAGKD